MNLSDLFEDALNTWAVRVVASFEPIGSLAHVWDEREREWFAARCDDVSDGDVGRKWRRKLAAFHVTS